MSGIDDSAQFAHDTAQNIYDASSAFLTDKAISAAQRNVTSGFLASWLASATAIVTAIFGAVFRAAAFIIANFLTGLDVVRENNQDSLNTIIAAALSDIMGVPVTSGDIPSKGGGQNNINIARGIGRKVLNVITQELGGNVGGDVGPGEAGAQGFLGFGINFAMNDGLLSFISELASIGYIKEFKEIPQALRGAMGLGRLTRLALQPPLHALVTVPYTREVNFKYRPHQLTANEYITAMDAGRLTEDEARTQLGQLGFDNLLVTEMFAQRKPKLKVHDIDALQRWGKITQDQALQMLRDDGIPVDIGQQMLDSLDLARADHAEQAYAAEILALAKGRYIDSVTYSSLIQRLHFSPAEQQGWLNRLGVYLDSQTKRLNLGEMLYLLEHNLLTTDQLDTWAAAEGYNPDTAAMLDLYLTQKSVDYDAAQKLKHDRALFNEQQKKAGGKPVPPDIINP